MYLHKFAIFRTGFRAERKSLSEQIKHTYMQIIKGAEIEFGEVIELWVTIKCTGFLQGIV